MKDRTAAHPHRQPQRQTRAQRRAAELAQRRQHKKQQRRFSTNALVGGIVTTLMVIAIAIYVYVQTTSNGRLKGLADPTTLNPATARGPSRVATAV